MADALTLLVRKAYAVAVVSERSHLDSCVQKANALTLLVQKADAVARVVRTTFAVALVVRKANVLAISVWCTYAQAFLVRSGMCADMCRPGSEYLASLRSEPLDVSVTYLASGRSPCIRTQNFFPDAMECLVNR